MEAALAEVREVAMALGRAAGVMVALAAVAMAKEDAEAKEEQAAAGWAGRVASLVVKGVEWL